MNRQEAMKIIESNRVYYRDFKHEEFNEALDRLKQPLTLTEFLGWEEDTEYRHQDNIFRANNDSVEKYIEQDDKWVIVCDKWSAVNVNQLRNAEKVEHKKKYQIPLPNLITTDGKQQYLTEKEGHWFASRLNPNLKQEWTEDEFHSIPTAYLIYAKMIGGSEHNDWHNIEVWGWVDE